MAKQIFVQIVSAAEGGFLDDTPLFSQLSYEEWMTEADVANVIQKEFVNIFESHKLDFADTAYFEGKNGQAIPPARIAEVTIAYALEPDYQFWWLVDQTEDIFDVYEENKQKTCLISCMDAAAKDAGWT